MPLEHLLDQLYYEIIARGYGALYVEAATITPIARYIQLSDKRKLFVSLSVIQAQGN